MYVLQLGFEAVDFGRALDLFIDGLKLKPET